jgi:large subunit ribosomal protein L3
MKGIIGRKLGMTQLFLDDGQVVPVTVVQAGPCPVVERKTRGEHGYEAIQLGYRDAKPSRVNKPLSGHFRKHGAPLCKVIREFPVEDSSFFSPGHVITVEAFRVGESVKITGVSKGRGFTGVMRRHNFKGAPGSHGTHEYFRHGGSIGSTSYPGRVFKGLRMAGQHGNHTVTTRNLKVVDIRIEDHVMLIKGAVPGPRGGIVILRGEGEFPPVVQSQAEPVVNGTPSS